jgi:HEAT repeat protein
MLAARALRQLDDPNARDAMVAALDDVDSSIRTTAFFFLAKHGDETLRARAMSALQQNRQDSGDNVGEAAAALLARFGTPDDAAQVRQLLDVVDDPYVHGGLLRALGRLTFVATHSSGDLPEWDAWYAQHRDETRVEWALDALRRAEEGSFLAGLWPVQVAMPYLAALGDARVVDHLERATDSRRWGVRVEAARAILTFDRAKGMRLLIRELTGRSYEACMTAHWTLNRLVGERRDIDCRSPAARNTAAADWRATEVPPGVLPQLW